MRLGVGFHTPHSPPSRRAVGREAAPPEPSSGRVRFARPRCAGARQDDNHITAALPGWRHERTPLWAFADSRVLKLMSEAARIVSGKSRMP